MTEYYTLLIRDWATQSWYTEYGSYDRQDVLAEQREYQDRGIATRIICTREDQTAIDLFVALLNGDDEVATLGMDDDIREDIHSHYDHGNNLVKFYREYCRCHRDKYGKAFQRDIGAARIIA